MRWLRVLILLVLITLPGAVLRADEPLRDEPKQPDSAAERPRIWWNSAQFVQSLSLQEEQRDAMDAALEARRAERREQAAPILPLRTRFAEQLAQGDWPGAEKTAQQISELAAAESAVNSALLLDVMKILTPQQRARLLELSPRILHRPWLRGGLGGGDAGLGPAPEARRQPVP